MRLIKLGQYLKTGIIEKIIAIKQGENLMEERQWQNRSCFSNENVVLSLDLIFMIIA